MSDRCRARVIRVKRDKHGAVLASAAAVGDTVLLVRDAGDLAADDEAGTLLVDDDAATQLTYTDVEYVEDTDQGDLTTPDAVTLSAALTVAIPADAQLWVYEEPEDPDDDGVVSDYTAICVPEDDEDAAVTGQPIKADIPPGEVRDNLPLGRQPDPGVPVVLEWDDDDNNWFVARLRGARKRAIQWEDGDVHVLTVEEVDAGVFTHPMSHTRILPKSVQVSWGPLVQDRALAGWSVDTAAGVLTYPLEGRERAGDVFPMQYQYLRKGSASDAPSGVVVPFSTPGWTYLQVAEGDGTDRSGTGYDDSTWAVGATPFGGGGTLSSATAWTPETDLWLRRTIHSTAGSVLVVTVRSEAAVIYWNGVQVDTFGNPAADSPLVDHATTVTSTGTDLLAIRLRDDTVPTGPAVYGDVEVAYQ